MNPDLLQAMMGSSFSHLNPGSYSPQDTMGSGLRDMGLSQLSQTNPQAAGLAQARLEAEANVNAMGPLEGYGWGAMLGAPIGGLLGAGLGYMGDSQGGGGVPGAIGMGALGTLAGGALGGMASRQYDVESRRAKAYQAALERLQATRAQV